MNRRDVLPEAALAALESALNWLHYRNAEPLDPIPQYKRFRPSYRFTSREVSMLRDMAKSAVWAEVGGKGAGWQGQVSHGFKSQRDLNEEGNGRTQWVGMPEWARGLDMNREAIQAAVEKAIAGETLGKRQRLAVQVMMDAMAENSAAADKCPF